jgi:hypothetical protein
MSVMSILAVAVRTALLTAAEYDATTPNEDIDACESH